MRALTFWTVPPVLICKLNSKVISGKMFLLQLSVFPCYSVHSSFYINMLFYIIFTIFKGKFCNNQERYVKPKLDAKIATSILKSLYHETLFLLQIMHSFPFYHHWTSLKGQAENDANCFNFIFSRVTMLFAEQCLGKQVGPVSAPGLTAVTHVSLLSILRWRVGYPRGTILTYCFSSSLSPKPLNLI